MYICCFDQAWTFIQSRASTQKAIITTCLVTCYIYACVSAPLQRASENMLHLFVCLPTSISIHLESNFKFFSCALWLSQGPQCPQIVPDSQRAEEGQPSSFQRGERERCWGGGGGGTVRGWIPGQPKWFWARWSTRGGFSWSWRRYCKAPKKIAIFRVGEIQRESSDGSGQSWDSRIGGTTEVPWCLFKTVFFPQSLHYFHWARKWRINIFVRPRHLLWGLLAVNPLLYQ